MQLYLLYPDSSVDVKCAGSAGTKDSVPLVCVQEYTNYHYNVMCL